jgi:hypothetical protein
MSRTRRWSRRKRGQGVQFEPDASGTARKRPQLFHVERLVSGLAILVRAAQRKPVRPPVMFHVELNSLASAMRFAEGLGHAVPRGTSRTALHTRATISAGLSRKKTGFSEVVQSRQKRFGDFRDAIREFSTQYRKSLSFRSLRRHLALFEPPQAGIAAKNAGRGSAPAIPMLPLVEPDPGHVPPPTG